MMMFAQLQVTQGQYAAAADTLGQVIGMRPDSVDAHFYLGVARARAAKPRLAATSWNTALEIDPRHLKSKVALGRLALAAGRHDDAMEIARDLQQIHPESPEGRLLEADTLVSGLELAKALAVYETVFQSHADGNVVIKLAQMHRLKGHPEKASIAIEAWLGKHPRDVKVLQSLAMFQYRDGETDKALQSYQRVVRLQPSNILALNNLAWIFEQNQKRSIALEYAERAHELAPDHFQILDTYGWLLIKSDKVEQGLALLTKAVEQAPNSGDIRYHQAEGLARAGEHDRARERLTALLKDSRPFDLRYSHRAGHRDGVHLLEPPNDATTNLIRQHFGDLLNRMGAYGKHLTCTNLENLFYVGVVLRVFPQSRVVLCRRHVLDTAVRMYFRLDPAARPFSGKLLHAVNHIKLFRKLTEHWHETFPDRTHCVDYEELVSNPDKSLAELMTFLGVDKNVAAVTEFRPH